MITYETRHDSHEKVNKEKRYMQIKEILGDKEMTAKEIADAMCKKGYIPTNERNFVSPRATELLHDGIIDVVGKKKCKWTGKTVSVFKLRKTAVQLNLFA